MERAIRTKIPVAFADLVFCSTQCITGYSVRATLNALEEMGLDRSCIPIRMGGDYAYYRDFDAWIRQRLSVEDAMGAAPLRQNARLAPPASNHGAVVATATATAADSRNFDQTADKKAAAVSVQAIVVGSHSASRRSSSSFNSGTTAGHAMGDDSRSSHSSNCTPPKLPSSSSSSSSPNLMQPLPGESPKDFQRRRQKSYANRSYHRKRRQEAELKQRHDHLQTSNQALRKANGHLERLLAQALYLVAAQQQLQQQLQLQPNNFSM